MKQSGRWIRFTIAGAALAVFQPARAADHADSENLLAVPAADINDLYAWTVDGGDRLVLALSVNRFANNPALGGNTEFDPAVLYSFHIDNDLDGTSDIHIDIQFNDNADAAGPHVMVTGVPSLGGGAATVLALEGDQASQGDVRVFAGLREDPFFFDLLWFIDFPDDHPLAFLNDDVDFYHNSGAALINDAPVDVFAGADVSMIVLELPTSDVLGDSGPEIGVWASTAM